MNYINRQIRFLTACIFVGLLLTLPVLSFATEEEDTLNGIIHAGRRQVGRKNQRIA